MALRNLGSLLHPGSAVIVGASQRAQSVGKALTDNLLRGGFTGPLYAVNPHRVDVAGLHWAPTVEALPETPELAVVCTPAATVPGVIEDLGRKGTKVAIVLSAGVTGELRRQMLTAAREHGLRIIGPNGIGAIMPHARLNASFAAARAIPGRLCFLSQSGALATAMLDWAAEREIGFSGIVSSGDMADTDLADLIDLFAGDPETHAILLYVESIAQPARFISAARAASRTKPIVAIKAGRSGAGGQAAATHSGALAGSYDVYEAAFRRAGIIVVDTLVELFDAAEVLCRARPIRGKRVAIVTNGGGAGVLALDAMTSPRLEPAGLEDSTIAALNEILPASWSHSNPVDIIGDATPERYQAAVEAVARDRNVDALIVVNCPTALASGSSAASAVASAAASAAQPVVACWMGGPNLKSAVPAFAPSGVPLFSEPEAAVRAIDYLAAAREAAEESRQKPQSCTAGVPDIAAARAIIARANGEGRAMLNELEAKALLAAYGVPVVKTRFAEKPSAIPMAAMGLLPPYVVKLVSPQITHKSDVGGVSLDLANLRAAEAAARLMTARVSRSNPEAEISGYAVEEMVSRPAAHELIAGIANDPTFGPVILVGAGGKAAEILNDRAISLPPLDDGLSRAMIERTRINALLRGYRDQPPADVEAVVRVLNALSQIAIDLPEVAELDINPLLVDATGAIALDARVRLGEATASRLAIRPVPQEWAADLVTRSGVKLHVRPARPEDEGALADLFRHMSAEDLRFRFLTGLHEVSRDQLCAMTRLDYRRTMNLLAFGEDGTLLASAILAGDPDGEKAEIALATRQGWKGKGVSWTLMDHALRYAEAQHIRSVVSIENADNLAAIAMEREMGFEIERSADAAGEVVVRKALKA